jgi:hypothetical protein
MDAISRAVHERGLCPVDRITRRNERRARLEKMAKIVPTGMFEPILLEPSSGSIATTYLASSLHSLVTSASFRSSDTIDPKWPDDCKISNSTRSASSSRKAILSLLEFIRELYPCTPRMPAVATIWLIIFTPRLMDVRSCVNSPVDSGFVRSRSRRNRCNVQVGIINFSMVFCLFGVQSACCLGAPYRFTAAKGRSILIESHSNNILNEFAALHQIRNPPLWSL